MDTKFEVIKHSSAIHIQNKITLLQRRAWNVLLYHAYDKLPTQEKHDLAIVKLIQRLEFSSKNEPYLKEALEALVSCKVKWNVLDKDGKWEWGVTTLLAEALIKDGICTYAYGPTLRERLHNPNMYARIDLTMQNKFDSKHAQALWELCLDYLHEVRGYGETPWIPLGTYRELMGIDAHQYSLFKLFNTRVIKEPVAEINRVTDFRVEVSYQRTQRKVYAIKFKTWRERALPGQDRRQVTLFPDLDDMPPLVEALKAAGLAAADAWHIWQQGAAVVEAADKPTPEAFEAYIREKIDLLERRQRMGKVESATGFLLSAIKHNYPNPEYQQRGKRRRAQQAQAQAERCAELERRFEAHREQVFWQRFAERPQAWQAEQRERLEGLLASEPAHRFVWQSYREHGSLKAPSVAGLLMARLASELLRQPEEVSLAAFAAWIERRDGSSR